MIKKKILISFLILIFLSSCDFSQRLITEDERLEFVENAATYINTPYLYGGNSSEGLDCSGLVVISAPSAYFYLGDDVFAEDANANEIMTYNTQNIESPEIGDLLFWVENGVAYHVAIYIKEELILDAFSISGEVNFRQIGTPPDVFGRLLINERVN